MRVFALLFVISFGLFPISAHAGIRDLYGNWAGTGIHTWPSGKQESGPASMEILGGREGNEFGFYTLTAGIFRSISVGFFRAKLGGTLVKICKERGVEREIAAGTWSEVGDITQLSIERDYYYDDCKLAPHRQFLRIKLTGKVNAHFEFLTDTGNSGVAQVTKRNP